jgi:hypothetical protein
MASPVKRQADLAGIPPSALFQRRDSLNFPLLRFDPPLWFVPEAPVLNLSVENNSHGIYFPFSVHRQRESTSFRLTGKLLLTQPEGLAKYPPAGPTLLATVPLSGFLNLSATLLLSPPPYRFQTGNTRGVAPFRGLVLSQSLRQLIAARLPS